jgi:hypothetical protein
LGEALALGCVCLRGVFFFAILSLFLYVVGR